MCGDLRIQWINIVSNYQEWGDYNNSFMICELHFPKESLVEENGSKILKRDSLPSMPIHEIEFVGLNESNYIDEQQNEVLNSIQNTNSDETENDLEFSEVDESHW